MRHEASLVLDLLRHPDHAPSLTLEDWDVVVPALRRAGLLARMGLQLRALGLERQLPARVADRITAALVVVEKHDRDVRAELGRLGDVLGDFIQPIVLLKGAAYLAAGLPAARGRVFGDIDILVPIDTLSAVEHMLGLAGWRLGEIDPYDDAYYRKWMHQLPPLQHTVRGSVIDLHHNLLPMTGRLRVASQQILGALAPLPSDPRFSILSRADIILHSAVHLFSGGEFHNGLRDLDDLNLLLGFFGNDAEFWTELLDRAALLGLELPLAYAFRAIDRLLVTSVPSRMAARLDANAPDRWQRSFTDRIFALALLPHHPSCQGRFASAALSLLYIRGHFQRMPLSMLVAHLTRKAYRRLFATD